MVLGQALAQAVEQAVVQAPAQEEEPALGRERVPDKAATSVQLVLPCVHLAVVAIAQMGTLA